jgi:hypothetical protein
VKLPVSSTIANNGSFLYDNNVKIVGQDTNESVLGVRISMKEGDRPIEIGNRSDVDERMKSEYNEEE